MTGQPTPLRETRRITPEVAAQMIERSKTREAHRAEYSRYVWAAHVERKARRRTTRSEVTA